MTHDSYGGSIDAELATSTFGEPSLYGLGDTGSRSVSGCDNSVDKSTPAANSGWTSNAGVLPAMRATEIAGRAADLVGGDRDRQHGQKHDNFSRIANMWNAWLRTRRDPAAPLDAHDVGVMMTVMKLARTQSGNFNIDDYVDACGYAACAGEVSGNTET